MSPQEVREPSVQEPDLAWRLARWETMTLIRCAEECIAEMVESGEARCPCHLCIGQEAVAAGVCAALTSEDSLWGGHRSHGHYLAKGGSLEGLFAEILGKDQGCSKGRGGSMHLFAKEVGILGTVPIVAGTVPLAVGAAFAARMRGDASVAVAFFGDGALEEGHVHESFNLAALYRLPVIFVCENNLYSSHLHWTDRRQADHLHRAGEFHAVPGESVDGNDVEAVFGATQTAVERARHGDGPSLLECRTFRWRGHVGASFDSDVGVKRRGELSEWMEKDPLVKLESRIESSGVWDLDRRRAALARAVQDTLHRARKGSDVDPQRGGEFVWSELSCAN